MLWLLSEMTQFASGLIGGMQGVPEAPPYFGRSSKAGELRIAMCLVAKPHPKRQEVDVDPDGAAPVRRVMLCVVLQV